MPPEATISSNTQRKQGCELRSAVGFSAIADAVDRDGVVGFVEEHAVIADAKAEQSFEVAAEGLDAARAGFGVAVDGFENVESGLLADGADFVRNVGLKADFLYAAA
jgi:hypothetical protein